MYFLTPSCIGLMALLLVLDESAQSLQQRMRMQKRRRIKEPKGTKLPCWEAEREASFVRRGQFCACQKTDNNHESEDYGLLMFPLLVL
jgi:hypothetical protein